MLVWKIQSGHDALGGQYGGKAAMAYSAGNLKEAVAG
jgi:hypothetical protein